MPDDSDDIEAARRSLDRQAPAKEYALVAIPSYREWSSRKLEEGESAALIARLDAMSMWLLPEKVANVGESEFDKLLADVKTTVEKDRRTRLALNLVLAAVGIWVAARDLCLLVKGPAVSGAALGQVAFGILLQALSITAFGTSINREVGYFRGVWDWVANPRLRGALWILPWWILFVSHHIIAKGLYSSGQIDRFMIAGRMGQALDQCCFFCVPGF